MKTNDRGEPMVGYNGHNVKLTSLLQIALFLGAIFTAGATWYDIRGGQIANAKQLSELKAEIVSNRAERNSALNDIVRLQVQVQNLGDQIAELKTAVTAR